MITINISADLTHLTQRLDAIDQKLAGHTVQLAQVKQGVEYVLSNQADQRVVLDRIDANTAETLRLVQFIANQFPVAASLNMTAGPVTEQP